MKIKNYILGGLILITASACGNDWLDLEPSTAVETQKSIKQLSDIEFVLYGIYSSMQSSDAYSGCLIYYGDVTGDDMQAVSSTKGPVTIIVSISQKTQALQYTGHLCMPLFKIATSF